MRSYRLPINRNSLRPSAFNPGLGRRLAARLHFPLSGLLERVALWLAHVPARVPKAKDLDLVGLAKKFGLSGSQIRTAALLAAAAQREGRYCAVRRRISWGRRRG